MVAASILFLVVQQGAQSKPPPPIVKATVATLVKDREAMDRKLVTVEGVVKDYEERVSRKGNPYTQFKLTDGGAEINVYVRFHVKPAPKDGQRVRVTGLFEKERKVGSRTVLNQVSAAPARDKRQGVVAVSATTP